MANETSSDPVVSIPLSGHLTVQTVKKALADINQAIAKVDKALTVNLKDVELIDTAGLQLLLYVKSICARDNIQCQLVEASDPVSTYLQRFHICTIDGVLL